MTKRIQTNGQNVLSEIGKSPALGLQRVALASKAQELVTEGQSNDNADTRARRVRSAGEIFADLVNRSRHSGKSR